MSFLLKDPAAVLDYSIDWGAEYLGVDELLAQSEWSVVPDEADGVSIAGSSFDPSIATVKAAGGTAGRIYKLVNQVTTGSGRVDERSIVIRVENR
jgi:hypothetical protein